MFKFLFSKKFYLGLGIALIAPIIICFISACGVNDLVLRASQNATTYSINAIYNDDTKMLYGSESVVYRNNSDNPLDNLQMHLYPNAFRLDAKYKPVSRANEDKAYPNGLSNGYIEVQNVKVEGKNVSYEIGGEDKNILVIPLTKVLEPKSTVEFTLEFNELLPNIRHRFGYTDKAVNLGNWYPIVCAMQNGQFQTDVYSYNGDPFFSDMANYNVSLTLNEKFIVAHTGDEIQTSVADSKKTITMKALAVRDFALSFSTAYNIKSEKIDGVNVCYYYYGDASPDKSLETSVRAVKTFNQLFGDYPYSKLDVVETGFLHGGMEYPNIVYISDDLDNYDDYTNTIVHEIAHQWWYGVVGDNENVDGWIDEGLAEYSTALFYDNNPEYEIQKDIIMRNTLNSYLLFIDVYKDIMGDVDTTMTRHLVDYRTEPEYTYMAYVKTVLMLHTIEDLVGTKKFLSALKYIYSHYAMKNISRNEYIKAFESACNIPLQKVFDSWLDGKIIIESP